MSGGTVRQLLKSWLAEIDKATGWKSSVSSDGLVGFETHEGVTIAIEAPEDVELLALFAEVGELPEDADPRMLRALLACNWFGRETGAASLGLEPGGRKLVLFQAWLDAARGDAAQFATLLTRFSRIAAQLRSRLAQGDLTDLPSGALPAAALGSVGGIRG